MLLDTSSSAGLRVRQLQLLLQLNSLLLQLQLILLQRSQQQLLR
jgi:hypothetical protein